MYKCFVHPWKEVSMIVDFVERWFLFIIFSFALMALKI